LDREASANEASLACSLTWTRGQVDPKGKPSSFKSIIVSSNLINLIDPCLDNNSLKCFRT
jgi:hypothetical protein